MTDNNVSVVNHGDPFGKGSNWYTFYCPTCGVQVSNRQETCMNKHPLVWLDIK
jgi:predicted RNA-binding Zn-ribbon protein involved in translation (DUF1610 family)